MDRPVISIIGYGYVGRAVHAAFKDRCDILINDLQYEDMRTPYIEMVKKSSCIFVCVPTPFNFEKKKPDYVDLDSVLDKIWKELNFNFDIDRDHEPYVIIKSTVSPYKIKHMRSKFDGKFPFILMPEFLRARYNVRDYLADNKFIAGSDPSVYSLEEMRNLCEIFHRYSMKSIYEVNFLYPEQAALLKYMLNAYHATKCILFNEFKNYADHKGICDEHFSYVLKLLCDNPQVGKLPTPYKVPGPDGKRGFGGECLPKDLNTLMHEDDGLKLFFLEDVWRNNMRYRGEEFGYEGEWLEHGRLS